MLIQDKIQNSSDLDQILYEGDALYNRTITSLKAEGKFINSLLSLEEIPNTVEIKTGQYCVEFANTSVCFRNSLSQVYI